MPLPGGWGSPPQRRTHSTHIPAEFCMRNSSARSFDHSRKGVWTSINSMILQQIVSRHDNFTKQINLYIIRSRARPTPLIKTPKFQTMMFSPLGYRRSTEWAECTPQIPGGAMVVSKQVRMWWETTPITSRILTNHSKKNWLGQNETTKLVQISLISIVYNWDQIGSYSWHHILKIEIQPLKVLRALESAQLPNQGVNVQHGYSKVSANGHESGVRKTLKATCTLNMTNWHLNPLTLEILEVILYCIYAWYTTGWHHFGMDFSMEWSWLPKIEPNTFTYKIPWCVIWPLRAFAISVHPLLQNMLGRTFCMIWPHLPQVPAVAASHLCWPQDRCRCRFIVECLADRTQDLYTLKYRDHMLVSISLCYK